MSFLLYTVLIEYNNMLVQNERSENGAKPLQTNTVEK